MADIGLLGARMLDPVGFWSYARQDDAHSDGQLSQLRAIVGKQIILQCGDEVKLWQDIVAIPFGVDWSSEIERTIGQTTFFIPIITPRFLKSRHCCDEFVAFRRRMQAMGRDDLIFPVHYVTVDDIRASETIFGEELDALRRHHWIDFRPLVFEDAKSTKVRQWAAQLATGILAAMRRDVAARRREEEIEAKRRAEELHPQNSLGQEEAQARRQTENNRIRPETEAQRRDPEVERNRREPADSDRRAGDGQDKRPPVSGPEAPPIPSRPGFRSHVAKFGRFVFRVWLAYAILVVAGPLKEWTTIKQRRANGEQVSRLVAAAKLSTSFLVGVGGSAIALYLAIVGGIMLLFLLSSFTGHWMR
jgi:hypothetical protein